MGASRFQMSEMSQVNGYQLLSELAFQSVGRKVGCKTARLSKENPKLSHCCIPTACQ